MSTSVTGSMGVYARQWAGATAKARSGNERIIFVLSYENGARQAETFHNSYS
jgi:hypothetical protein